MEKIRYPYVFKTSFLVLLGIIIFNSACNVGVENELNEIQQSSFDRINLLNIAIDNSLITAIESTQRAEKSPKEKDIELYFDPAQNTIYLQGKGIKDFQLFDGGISLNLNQLQISEETLSHLKEKQAETDKSSQLRSYADVDCPGCHSFIEGTWNGTYHVLIAKCEPADSSIPECNLLFCTEGNVLTVYCRPGPSINGPGGFPPCPGSVCEN